MHDCLPTTEKQQERDDHGGVWLGDVWKGIAYLRINRSDIQIEVVDTDLGCGVITKKDSKKWDTKGEEWNVYGYYKSNKSTSPIALVLQPHPQYGGTMNNKIIYNYFKFIGIIIYIDCNIIKGYSRFICK